MNEIIKSGFLVTGGVSQRGCVHYSREEVEGETKEDRFRGNWKTEKKIDSVTEQTNLMKTRMQIENNIRRIGFSVGSMGFLVPVERGDELKKQLEVAKKLVREWNRVAKYTSLRYEFIVFTVSGKDEQLALTLYNKVTELLEDADKAIQKGDVKGLRKVLYSLSDLDGILPNEMEKSVKDIVEKAKNRAKEAVKKTKTLAEGGKEKMIAKLLKAESAPVKAIRAGMIEVIEKIGEKETVKLPIVHIREVE